MTLFIQRAEHRDTQALHAKLDELLRAASEADSETATVDKKEPEEIEVQREWKQQGDSPKRWNTMNTDRQASSPTSPVSQRRANRGYPDRKLARGQHRQKRSEMPAGATSASQCV
jgi:hypothetical protein